MTRTLTLDPIEAASKIGDSYLRYLKSRHALRDPDLRSAFHHALEAFQLTKGPLLQVSAPYQTGSSLTDLIAGQYLNQGFLEIPTDAFPAERPLYRHQELAITKLLSGRNLIVATGTGSGKTECFLFPILNYLLQERDTGTLSAPGVRALLLYPMNALANDQMKRLRDLIGAFPDITFGRFVGDTEDSLRSATEAYRVIHGTDPLENELICRDQMRECPPHILLTNYAMLEYLLLRPADTKIFDGATGRHWRFIILDEVHVYNGAQAGEIAMLLRRVRDRVNRSEKGRIQYVGTSATLGRDEQDFPNLARYGTELFDETVEFIPTDPDRQDVVPPYREPLIASSATWKGDIDLFADALKAMQTNSIDQQLSDRLTELGAPPIRSDLPVVETMGGTFSSEAHVIQLQELLERGSIEMRIAADHVFGSNGGLQALTSLVAACTAARVPASGSPVIPARYHFLIRALEGAFLCRAPSHPAGRPAMTLTRHENCPGCLENDKISKMFESGVCSKCGAAYLIGISEEDKEGNTYLKSARSFESNLRYLLLDDSLEPGDDDEDEEALVDNETAAAEVDDRVLCTCCGSLTEGTLPSCRCGPGPTIRVVVAHPARSGEPLRRCVACSGRSKAPIILRFLTGQDAPVSVIATSLYQALPPNRQGDSLPTIGEGRKLLSFSDSRQDAAFFAPYFDRTYSRAVQRRLIWQVAHRMAAQEPRFMDLVLPIRRDAESHLVLDEDRGPTHNANQVRTWLMREVLAVDRRQSLDGVGLAEISFVLPRGVEVPPVLTDLGLSDEEALNLARILLETLRAQACVHIPEGVDIADQIFSPRNVVTRVRQEQRGPGIVSWVPGRGLNRRLDFLDKLATRRSIGINTTELLATIWQRWIAAPNSLWRKVLKPVTDAKHGFLFAIDPEWLSVRPATSEQPAYRCNKCRQVWWRSISGVCPTYMCQGTLEAIPLHPNGAGDHYRHLYTNLDLIGMSVEEHTGQLESNYAGKIQQGFVDGKINVLSCSTTFELGVDVGEVQGILMRNVPPSPANYIQRAGRAGRRLGTQALVVTFAQRRNHDLHYFDNPRNLIDGHISTPIISLQNAQIVRRHLHAVAFAAFERAHVDSGGQWHQNVSSFFMPDKDNNQSAFDLFKDWLTDQPQDVGDAITRITPTKLAGVIGTKTWDWVTALTKENDEVENHGWLKRATEEVRTDLSQLDSELDSVQERMNRHRLQGEDKKASSLAGHQQNLFRHKATLADRRLIDYLAQRVVLPKYGFPVDVVSLDIRQLGNSRAPQLDLSRDLRLGITDYAPGSKVVADKSLWETAGLKIPAGRALISYIWVICGNCETFRTQRSIDRDDIGICGICKSQEVRSRREFVIPMFGFIGKRSDEKPGETRPLREGNSVFYFSDYAHGEPEMTSRNVGKHKVQLNFSRQGQITVINRGTAGQGFQICLTCGYAEPAPKSPRKRRKSSKPINHERPGIKRECSSILVNRHLGHQYLTDVIEIHLPIQMTTEEARSTLYALLAGTHGIGIARNDVDGTLRSTGAGKPPSIILFDTVPGGAGHARRIWDRFLDLIEAARSVTANCECGTDSSCYGCLRSYSNQPYHDKLIRGDARKVLSDLLA